MAEDLPGYSKLEGIWSATFAADVEDINDPAFVIMESFDLQTKIGPCRWQTRGTNLPEKDMDCLVAYDEFEQPYVITWWDGTAGGLAKRHVGSSPPSSPSEGDEWLLPVGSGVNWLFRYNAGSASSYKWEFMGGSSQLDQVDAIESTSSGSYTNLTTAGPGITISRAGDYNIRYGCKMISPTGFAFRCCSTVKLGSAAASENEQIVMGGPGMAAIAMDASLSREIRRTLAASDQILMQYHQDGGNSVGFQWRWLEVTPVRII